MTQREQEANQLILNEIEKATGLLIQHMEKYCEDHQTKAVPIIVIKGYAKIMLSAMREAITSKEHEGHT